MNKSSKGAGIPAELFQNLKMMLLKCFTQYAIKFGTFSSGHRNGKCFHFNLKEKQCQRMFKLPHNCTHFTHQQSNAENSPSQASKGREPKTSSGFKLDLVKAEEPQSKFPTPFGSQKKQENSRKTSTSRLLTMPKLLTVWIKTNYGKFLKRWEYQNNTRTPYLTPEKPVCRSRSNSWNRTWNNGLVPNWERRTSRLYIAPCLFNFYAGKTHHVKCWAG